MPNQRIEFAPAKPGDQTDQTGTSKKFSYSEFYQDGRDVARNGDCRPISRESESGVKTFFLNALMAVHEFPLGFSTPLLGVSGKCTWAMYSALL